MVTTQSFSHGRTIDRFWGAIIAFSVLVFLALPTTRAAGSSPLTAKPISPNILFILADNWRWPNAGVLGDPLAKTPTFDRIAREGVLFNHAFNPVPSCSPTRACILTGKIAHQLGERASLWSAFPKDTPVISELLRDAGYEIGFSGKGWGPGNFEDSGWKENPVGPKFESFPDFLESHDEKHPFFFWLGNTDTATKGGKLPYLDAAKKVLDAKDLSIPAELPDCNELRDDLLNYYGGILKLDEEATQALAALEKRGLIDDTIILYGSDNGWQMPRGLANCYDRGSRVPLAIRWNKIPKVGTRSEAFVNLGEIGPTILEMAGLKVPKEMSFRSFKNLLTGQEDGLDREAVFIERERHANVRKENQSYPVRAIRTKDYLYLCNLRPNRWPAGDPDVTFLHGRPFGDVDTTRVKDFLLGKRNEKAFESYFRWIFEKRPKEELYDLSKDPDQLQNVAEDPHYDSIKRALSGRLHQWMAETKDPRIDPNDDAWDRFPYFGRSPKP